MSLTHDGHFVPPSLLPLGQPAIVPAHLGFLAIYNPSLGGKGDDGLEDQIVYYYSATSKTRRQKSKAATQVNSPLGKPLQPPVEDGLKYEQEKNERLRHIGLAQGMTDFARGFSEGEPVDTVDTERTRVILHELEPGWWIVASVNLTRLPRQSPQSGGSKSANSSVDSSKLDADYSSREVKPAALLLADLQRAHRLFLMHHAPSLSCLWTQLSHDDESRLPAAEISQAASRTSARSNAKFLSLMGKYWDRFLVTWSVLLQGNPARDIFGGIRVAACGELGVGVGEEERGSGIRDVLEGLVGRIPGLVDLVVGRFGNFDADGQQSDAADIQEEDQWLGTGEEPGHEDGAVFLGVGALTRPSLRNVACWMDDIFSWGARAYGISGNSVFTSKQAPTRSDSIKTPSISSFSKLSVASPAESPPAEHTEAVSPAAKSLEALIKSPAQTPSVTPLSKSAPPKIDGDNDVADDNDAGKDDGDDKIGFLTIKLSNRKSPAKSIASSSQSGADGSVNKFVSYLKLGYGTHWSLPGTGSDAKTEEPLQATRRCSESAGRYLVGLHGDLDSSNSDMKNHHGNMGHDATGDCSDGPVSRISRHILTLEMAKRPLDQLDTKHNISASQKADQPADSRAQLDEACSELRVVVYTMKPFIVILLFDRNTKNLQSPALYRTLHEELYLLQESLVHSTNFRPRRSMGTGNSTPSYFKSGSPAQRSATSPASKNHCNIYDVLYDFDKLTVHCTIPPIPEPAIVYMKRHRHGNSNWTRSIGSSWFGGGDQNDSSTGRDHDDEQPIWSRVEALNTHSQLLNIWAATRPRRRWPSELERTGRTNRGWWIVWSRLVDGTETDILHEATDADSNRRADKEVFILKRATDAQGAAGGDPAAAAAAGGVTSTLGGIWDWDKGDNDTTPSSAQMLSMDTRAYIDGLLRLNR